MGNNEPPLLHNNNRNWPVLIIQKQQECERPGEELAQQWLTQVHTLNLKLWLPTAFRLNAPSAVRWNKWDERGQ